MAEFDVWFSRHNGHLYVVSSEPDKPPTTRPNKVASGRGPAEVLRRLRLTGHSISQVGILPPEVIGLIEVEV